MTMTTGNAADNAIRKTLREAGPSASVDVRLIDGSTLTGTVTVEERRYVITAGSKTWTVPTGHVLAVAVAA